MVIGMTASQFARFSGGRRRPRTRASGGVFLAVLGVLAVGLGAAFVLAPGALASAAGGGYADQGAVVAALSAAFVGYWSSGDRSYPPALERLVDYWIRYHVAKAVIAALLLTVLVVLAARLWGTLLRAGRLAPGRVVALASSGALVTVLAVFSVVLVMANVQDVVAPLASLISLLPPGAPGTQLARTVGQVRQRLAGYPGAGSRTPPALGAMVGNFALYHATLAVLAAIVAVIVIGLSVLSWRRRARAGSSERRVRRALEWAGVLSALLALAVIVVAVANLETAMNPAPALLAFFTGGTGGL